MYCFKFGIWNKINGYSSGFVFLISVRLISCGISLLSIESLNPDNML